MSGIDGRMIDRSNYSNNTLDTYGYLSAYFIDIYYNHLYSEAITLYSKKDVPSITIGYKCTLDAFLKGIDSPEVFKSCIQGIHESFLKYGFPSLSFSHCINKIVNEFIPKDYFNIMSFDDKTQILRKILIDSNKKLILEIVKPPSNLLKDIIDNHNDNDNINILQDIYIDILIMLREQLYQQFVEENIGSSRDNDMVIAMQKEIKLLYNEKNDLDKQILSLKQDILNHKKLILKLKKECNEKNNYISELEVQLQSNNQENEYNNKTYLQSNTKENEYNKDNRNNNQENEYNRDNDSEDNGDNNSEDNRENYRNNDNGENNRDNSRDNDNNSEISNESDTDLFLIDD
jgi:hypothetical protein